MKQTRSILKIAAISIAGGFLLLVGSISVRLAVAAQQAPTPEAILVLGGGAGREEAAATLARYYTDLEVWVSSGDKPPAPAYAVFQAAGVNRDRVHLDYRATDTVTNFTTLVADWRRRGIQHLYVVTSDFHMSRARAIAFIVLGSQGITFTPVAVPSDRPPEELPRILRDMLRSLLWLVTGRTGASLGERLTNALN
ncbi:MAG: YdcF family protein [Synechococcales cyanobacterium M58_A2018_015]|nr:YdcF family protein [Synechococcales cyanobacterium M58_A2018_015]